MAKTTKSQTGSKSITDYFSRTTRLSQSKQSEVAQQKVASDADASVSSPNITSKSLAPSSENRTHLRSRTPEVSSHVKSSSMAKSPSPARTSGKRKTKFGVDSVPEISTSALIVSRSSCGPVPPTPLSPKETDARKKMRLSSPETSSVDEVPGSVSGEEEMVPEPRVVRDVVVSNRSVAKWREESSLPNISDDMDVDEVSACPIEAEKSAFDPERDTTPPYQQLTPPETTTKTPLDTAAKTQQLIAEIKARALAAARSSPTAKEHRPFKDTLTDSESEDELLPRAIETKGKGKGKGKLVAKSTPVLSTHPNTRSANAQTSSSSSRRVSLSPVVPSAKHERKKTTNKASNPFTALLKEKRTEDRRGYSTLDYIKAAETVLEKNKILLESDEDDEVDGKVDLDYGDRQRLFGDQGENIQDILDGDCEDREAGELQQSRKGVPLWKDHVSRDDDMDMDAEPALDFGDYNQQPVLRMLYQAFKSGDEVRAINLLNSGLLATLNFDNYERVVGYLCYLALSPAYGDLGSAAFKALLNINMSRGRQPGILQNILTALSGLGAKSESLNLTHIKSPNLDHQRRETLVFRLVRLIGSSAQRLILDEIPEIVIVLLAISLDSSTSAIIQQEIAVVLDAIFCSIADLNVVAEIEPVICTKIVSFISKLEGVNISHTVTLLAGGPGRSTRIARWVARSVILGKTQVMEAEYCHSPAVDGLSEVLIQGAATRCQAFQVTKDTDYAEMGHYTQILAIALTDIPSYIPQEIAAMAALKAKDSVQNSPSKDKLETPLQHLHACVNFLHRKITDHGTNIERSRTKAALLNLSMRLHYQLIVRSSSGRPSNIQHYFNRGNGSANKS